MDATDSHAIQFIVCGLAGTNPYTAKGDTYTVKFLNKTDHFMVIKADQQQMKCTVHEKNEKIFDQFTINKKDRDQYVENASLWAGEIE